MNLDKLKELEAKATQWDVAYIRCDCANDRLFFEYEDGRQVYLTFDDMRDVVEAWNNAKEMISTIERYKTALEGLVGRIESYGDRVLLKSQFYIDAKKALKGSDSAGVINDT